MANNIEQWRLIDGYDNYEVSSHGRVRNNNSARMLAPIMGTGGHKRVNLSKQQIRQCSEIHVLVAQAFCDNAHGYTVVDHIDRNKSNNRSDNLRWCTPSMNAKNKKIATNSPSGITGIRLTADQTTWRSSWSQDLCEHVKSFSVRKYGFEQAKQMAIDHRKNMEAQHGYLGEHNF